MATCIYCPAQHFSVEDPLPAGLGNFENYEYLSDRICRACNGVCGKLDEQLCRSGPEALFRMFLGVKGRKRHTKSNPFYQGSAGGGRLEMTGKNQNTGSEVLIELLNDTEARELRCAQLFADDSTTPCTIPILDGMTPPEFRAAFDRTGIKWFKKGVVYAGPEEQEWVESLIATLKFETKTTWTKPQGPVTYGPSVVKFEVTSRYFRAIAKIGFHYFLTKMPQFRGDEACFRDIRNFIITDSCPVDKCRNFVSYNGQHVAWQLNNGGRLTAWGHFLVAEMDYLTLKAKVELFAGPGKRPLTYVVRLGRNPSLLDYRDGHADFFEYFPKEQRGVFDGRVSPLPVSTPMPRLEIPILSLPNFSWQLP